MLRKILLQFVIMAMIFTGVSSVASAQFYKDVPDDSNLIEEFIVLSEYGVIDVNVNEKFRLNDGITRYEVAELIVRTLQVDPELSPIPTYEDIQADDPRMQIVAAITQLGIMTGFEGKFNPDTKVTRAQAAKLLAHAFHLSGELESEFSDVRVTHTAYPAIDALVANQIIGSTDGKFYPNTVVTRANFAVFMARIIDPTLRTIKSPDAQLPVYDSCERETEKKTYQVDVAVTNLWKNYNTARKVDYPSTTNPVEMQKWISSLSLAQKKWLVDRTDTQSLYGDEVTVLETKGSWMRVAAKDQYVAYLEAGYPGWVPKSHISSTTKNYDDCAIAIVTAKKASLYEENKKTKFLEISYATILPVIKEEEKFYHVQTPSDGVKLLRKADAKAYENYSDVPKPTAETIIKEAKRYLDLPYLWAGTSSWGYDCSGILYAAFRAHGVMIPRDSFYQAEGGKVVAKKDLKPGDLVFFAYNGGKGKVYHVGLYLGDGKMLHAPHYASKVKIESMNNGKYKTNYSGARRYL